MKVRDVIKLVVKVRDVIKLVEADGWYLIEIRGSHRQYKHPVKKGKVTIPVHAGKDVDPRTYNSILKQAQMN